MGVVEELDEQLFTILDVVRTLIPEEQDGLGIVTEIRRYTDGRHTYRVAPMDRDDEVVGGYYGSHQLAATGSRETTRFFWEGQLRKREVVMVTDDHPREAWRGRYGVVADVLDEAVYEVELSHVRKTRLRTRTREIDGRHLRSTGDRLRPEPVPRGVITWRGTDVNPRPTNEFEIVDELDQYL